MMAGRRARLRLVIFDCDGVLVLSKFTGAAIELKFGFDGFARLCSEPGETGDRFWLTH